MKSTEIALLLNDDAEKITRIGEIIVKKKSENDDFSNLNEFEKTFIFVDLLKDNITNGGFIQFFFKSSGQFTYEILQAYMDIKAEKTIAILQKAIHLFPQRPVPKKLRLRQGVLMQKESNIDLWDALDLEFEKNKEEITPLILKYVHLNISHFD